MLDSSLPGQTLVRLPASKRTVGRHYLVVAEAADGHQEEHYLFIPAAATDRGYQPVPLRPAETSPSAPPQEFCLDGLIGDSTPGFLTVEDESGE